MEVDKTCKFTGSAIAAWTGGSHLEKPPPAGDGVHRSTCPSHGAAVIFHFVVLLHSNSGLISNCQSLYQLDAGLIHLQNPLYLGLSLGGGHMRKLPASSIQAENPGSGSGVVAALSSLAELGSDRGVGCYVSLQLRGQCPCRCSHPLED